MDASHFLQGYACIQISSRFSTYHIVLIHLLTVMWWMKALSHMTHVYSGVHVTCGLVPLYLKYLQQRPRSALRSWMCCCPICAYFIASSSTFQVGGWRPLPSIHLVRPACTAASVFRGWSSKHGPIVAVWSPTPSRTALPLSAAVLLTCILKNLRCLGWSAENTIKKHHTFPH